MKPTPTPRKRRPSYSLSPDTIADLDLLALDTARSRGTAPNRSGELAELIRAAMVARGLRRVGAAGKWRAER